MLEVRGINYIYMLRILQFMLQISKIVIHQFKREKNTASYFI